MRTPNYLQKGDKVVILSTARKIQKIEIDFAIQLLENWGLQVELGKSIGPEAHQFAGSDELRLNDLQHALNDESIKTIFCARGGYGTVRILDRLEWTQFMDNPKWLVGYSDITYLHNWLQDKLGVESLHATMPAFFEKDTDAALASIKDVLFGHSISYAFDPHQLNRMGSAKGELVGGNLSIIYSLLGTSSRFITDGRILFLEDLDEYLYHIDRMMMALKRAGKLKNLAGLVIGGMNDMNDNAIPFGKTAVEIIKEHTEEYNYPIAYNLPAGHVADNRSLIFGRTATLKVESEQSKLHFE